MIARTVRNFESCDAVSEIVIVTREDLIVPISNLCKDMPKVKAVVVGGKSRQESVHLGLNALSKKVKLAAVHDGARPLITWQVIDRTVRAANTYGAAAPAIPVKDTIKIADDEGYTAQTPARSLVWMVQTPQVFELSLIAGAYGELIEKEAQLLEQGIQITDDACVAELFTTQKVKLVQGSYENIKITTPEDLMIAEAFLQR